jgi:YesN/AraC family two-component response regulator
MHKILLVDDEPDILETLKELVEDQFDCSIDTASSGLDAFVLCGKSKYDLIITDHKMPLMTGSAFIMATRTKENLNQKTPFIMLSGFIDDQMKSELSGHQVEFLNKPVLPTTLFSSIENKLS